MVNFLCKQINYIEQCRTECNLFMKYQGVYFIDLKKLIKMKTSIQDLCVFRVGGGWGELCIVS